MWYPIECEHDYDACPICDRRKKEMRIDSFEHCYWIFLRKYILRIGKPFGHNYKYAWKPFITIFKLKP